MGLLDSVLGAVMGGGQGGGGNADLLNAVVGMLGQDSAAGGLGGILQKAQQAGLGDVVSSWIGSGQNMPIDAAQIGSILGSPAVAQIAEQLGLSHGDASGQLAQMLPQMVDKLTPHGQMPEGGLGSMADILGAFNKG